MNSVVTLLLLFVCSGYVVHPQSNFGIQESPSENSVVLSEILVNYIVKYLSDDQIFLSIILGSSSNERNHFHADLFYHLFDNPNLKEFSYKVLYRLGNVRGGKRSGFDLILIDDTKSLKENLNNKTIQEYHLFRKYMIIVNGNAKNTTESETLNDIFNVLWSNGLVNSHVLIQDKSGIWSLYNFMPYQTDCFSLDHVKITSFSANNSTANITQSMRQMYPQKLHNFHKCPLFVAVSVVEPFVIRKNTSDGIVKYVGIEIEIIEQISKSLNFVISYKRTSDGTENGLILRNGTVTGNMKLVEDGDVNLTIGGYVISKSRSLRFAASNPYLGASIGFASKESDSFLPFTSLTAPFSIQFWLLSCGVIFSIIVLILLSKKLTQKWRHFYIGGQMNRTPVLNIWALVLGIPIPNRRIASGRNFSNFARTLMLLWSLLWIVIRNSYQGALYTHLNNDRLSSPYDTIEKIRTSDCNIITSHSLSFIARNLFQLDRIIVHKGALEANVLMLYDKEINGVALESDLSVKFYNLENPHRRMIFTKDRLFRFSPLFLYRKNSVLTRVFNTQLLALQGSGLIDYWTHNYIDVRKSNSKKRQPSKIRFGNVFAIFQICAVMYLVSAVMFVLEIVSVKCRRIKIVLEYLTY